MCDLFAIWYDVRMALVVLRMLCFRLNESKGRSRWELMLNVTANQPGLHDKEKKTATGLVAKWPLI